MNASTDTSITIETLFKSPIEKIWQAWTDPDLVLQWFGSDPDGCGINAKLDVQPGGNFEVTFQDADGTQHTCFGKYVEVSKPNKLSFTWAWKSELGFESVVTVLLTAREQTTHQHFEHAGLGNPSIHNYLKGWTTTFEKLGKLLTTGE